MNRLYAALLSAAAVAALWGGSLLWARHQGAEAERPKTELAADDAAGRGLEVKGAAQIAGAVDALTRRSAALQEATNDFRNATLSTPGLAAPLDPVRAARLHAHDRFLCDASPGACASATGGDAGGGEGGL